MQNLNKVVKDTNSSSLVQEIRSIREFSNNLFSEREIRILIHLLNSLKTDFNKINLDGIKKFIFIQDVLLAEPLRNLKILLNENIIYIYAVLKLLPTSEDIEKSYITSIRNNLWEKYKTYMTKKFTIELKKEEQINPFILSETIFDVAHLLNAKIIDNKKIDEEIKKFSQNLKNYYLELSKASNYFLN
jgi:hypothetical protein